MKKYKILPKEAIINFIVLCIIIVLMLTIIEKLMPQYEKWKKQDYLIEADQYYEMMKTCKEDYPLITLRRKDIISTEENKKKILVIGDSYIQGDGTSNLNQTWWRQLELELYSRGYYDVEVYGVGEDGASTYDEMNWLSTTTLVEDINPDIVIMGYVSNDPEIDNEYGTPIVKKLGSIDYFSQNAQLKTIKNLIPNISYKINNMINNKIEKTKEYNDETGYPEGIWQNVIVNEKWSKIYEQKAIKPLGEYLNSINIPSFVITTPNSVSRWIEENYKVLPLFENSGIKLYNLYSEYFKKFQHNKNNMKINPVNGHPGTSSTNFYAKYISDILEKDYPQVLGNKYEDKIEYPICINDWFPYVLNLKVKEEKDEYAKYKVKYPKKENMLRMPIDEDYIKISLQYPISLKEISLRGETLNEAKLYITTIKEELGYDDQTMYLVGKQKGNEEKFQLQGDKLITSICIHADILEGSELEITIKQGGD